MMLMKVCPSCGWRTDNVSNEYFDEEKICPICETVLYIYKPLGGIE
jgi:hypothetical protein